MSNPEGPKEQTFSDFDEFDNAGEWDPDDSWENFWDDADFELTEEQQRNRESWGNHTSDEDYDPNVRLSEDDLMARDIDSMRRKRDEFREQRAQELFERALNEEMVNLEELSMLAEAGADGLSAEEIEYKGKKIQVIHVPIGYKIMFLKTSINSNLVAKDPSLWTINGNTYDSFSDREGDTIVFDPKNGEVSNTICTNLVDTVITPKVIRNGAQGVDYVFTHVRPDSVIKAGSGDMWSTPNEGSGKSHVLDSGPKMPDQITEKTESFNEVTLRRYDERGEPLLPTALMTTNGYLEEENMLKSAAYFNVPILDIAVER